MEKDVRDRYIQGALTVGADDTGYDVTFYGATSGCKFLWDESADKAYVNGQLDVSGAASLSNTVLIQNAVTLDSSGRVYKEIFIPAKVWDVTGSTAAEGQHSSRFPVILLTATDSGSSTEDIYATWPAPNDIDTSACMRATVLWSQDIAAASAKAQWVINASMWGDGEVNAGTTYAGTAAPFQVSSSEANVINSTSVMNDMGPPAVGDLMGFHFSYYGSGSSTTGSDMVFHGLKIRYTANKLGAAT